MRRTGHYTDCAEHRKTHPRPSAEEAESALAGISAAPIIPLTITRAESALARESATAIIALAITPRAGILGAYLAPPNGIGSVWLAPVLMAAAVFCGFLDAAAGRDEDSVEAAISAGAAAADLGRFAWEPVGTLGAEDAGSATRSGAAMRPIAIAAIGGRSVSTRIARGLRALPATHLPSR